MRRTLVGFVLFASLAASAIWWGRAGDTGSSVSDAAPSGALSPGSGIPDEAPATLPGVDLAEVRAALPDNRYWVDGLPTRDQDVLASRKRAADERNLLYGRVLSGTATGAEIDAYYDERQRTSEDYVAFSRYVLENYRSVLTERDADMLELARSMNAQRLGQLPDERLRAHVRRQEQDRARADWNDQRPGG